MSSAPIGTTATRRGGGSNIRRASGYRRPMCLTQSSTSSSYGSNTNTLVDRANLLLDRRISAALRLTPFSIGAHASVLPPPIIAAPRRSVAVIRSASATSVGSGPPLLAPLVAAAVAHLPSIPTPDELTRLRLLHLAAPQSQAEALRGALLASVNNLAFFSVDRGVRTVTIPIGTNVDPSLFLSVSNQIVHDFQQHDVWRVTTDMHGAHAGDFAAAALRFESISDLAQHPDRTARP